MGCEYTLKERHQQTFINNKTKQNLVSSDPLSVMQCFQDRESKNWTEQNLTQLGMLVKKGQNNKIINLHDKTVIHTSRLVYMHQNSYIYIKIRIYKSRFVYIHQDSFILIKIRIYTSRFV